MPKASASGASAGFDAERLDPAIAGAIDRLTKTVADVERIRGGIEPLLDRVREQLVANLASNALTGPQLLADTERMIEWLDRYAKTALNLTKLTDEATRLRSFVAGGADSRPDLGTLSDSELAKIVTEAAELARAKA